jgi:hypothetical protein
MLRTYVTEKGQIDYFVVVKKKGRSKDAQDPNQVTEAEKVLFEKLEEDYKRVKGDVEKVS